MSRLAAAGLPVRLAPSVAVVLAGGLLVACGGGGSNAGSSPQAPTPAASSSPSASTAASPSTAASTSTAAAAQDVAYKPLAARMAAAMQRAATAHVTMTSDGEAGTKATGQLRRSADGFSATMSITTGGRTMKEVMLPDAFYLSGKDLAGQGKWIAITKGGKDPLSQLLVPLIETVQQSADPTKSLLKTTATSAQRTGSQVVDGVQTTIYTVELSGADVLNSLPESTRKLLVGKTAGFKGVLRMFLGDDDLPRRVLATTTTAGKTATMDIRYSQWGAPVTIMAPPKSKIVPLSQLGG